MKDSDAQKLIGNIKKLSVLLAMMTTHVQHFMEELLSVSNTITEASLTVEDILKDLPPEVYKGLTTKKDDPPKGEVDIKKEGFVNLVKRIINQGRVKP